MDDMDDDVETIDLRDDFSVYKKGHPIIRQMDIGNFSSRECPSIHLGIWDVILDPQADKRLREMEIRERSKIAGKAATLRYQQEMERRADRRERSNWTKILNVRKVGKQLYPTFYFLGEDVAKFKKLPKFRSKSPDQIFNTPPPDFQAALTRLANLKTQIKMSPAAAWQASYNRLMDIDTRATDMASFINNRRTVTEGQEGLIGKWEAAVKSISERAS
jgi:hypothetical protein